MKSKEKEISDRVGNIVDEKLGSYKTTDGFIERCMRDGKLRNYIEKISKKETKNTINQMAVNTFKFWIPILISASALAVALFFD